MVSRNLNDEVCMSSSISRSLSSKLKGKEALLASIGGRVVSTASTSVDAIRNEISFLENHILDINSIIEAINLDSYSDVTSSSHPDTEEESYIQRFLKARDGFIDALKLRKRILKWKHEEKQQDDMNLHITLPCISKKRWPRICKILSYRARTIESSIEMLHRARMAATNSYFSDLKLSGWIQFLGDLSHEIQNFFLDNTLPFIQQCAVNLEAACPNSCTLPILHTGANRDLRFSRALCASLLASSFFSLFLLKHRPECNFGVKFFSYSSPSQFSKFMCILQYFEGMRTNGDLPGDIQIISRTVPVVTEESLLEEEPVPLCDVDVRETGLIEDADEEESSTQSVLQIDFANKWIGGGVLRTGCVQEEIRFIISPETLISLLLCMQMREDQSITIIGARRFSQYQGYAHRFRCSGQIIQSLSEKPSVIVAIDALVAHGKKKWGVQGQYNRNAMLRELTKALSGFSIPDETLPHNCTWIATGNWGCGAFGGDPQLKALLQWIAVSLCRGHVRSEASSTKKSHRSMRYFTFESSLVSDLASIVSILRKSGVCSVAQLWSLLCAYSDSMLTNVISPSRERKQAGSRISLFEFLLNEVRRETFS